MPIYEYSCTQCGQKFEARQPFGADGSKLNCPICHTPEPKKEFSVFCFTGTDSRGSPGSGSSCSTCTGGNCSSCSL